MIIKIYIHLPQEETKFTPENQVPKINAYYHHTVNVILKNWYFFSSNLSGLSKYQDAIEAGMNNYDCTLLYSQCSGSYFGYWKLKLSLKSILSSAKYWESQILSIVA